MRHAPGPCALAMILVATPAFAGPDVRYVAVDTAEVRALASTAQASYVTNRLRRGAAVEVVAAAGNGWVKVRPPRGSFSYINARFLEHVVPDMPNLVVAIEKTEVPVLVGSEVIDTHRPTVIGVKLKRGAQVTSLGKPKKDDDGEWMPIEPPPGEVRYLLASALTAPGAPAPPTGPPTQPAERSEFLPSTAPSANVTESAEARWARAVRAEQLGQYGDAARLYRSVWQDAQRTNPALARQAAERLARLEGRPSSPTAHSPTPRLRAPQSLGGSGAGGPTLTAGPRIGTAASSSWRVYRGRLQRAGRSDFPDMTHRLEVDRLGAWHHLTYLRAAPGVNLGALADRGEVEVQGEVWYQGELKTFVMYVRRATLISR